MEERPQITSFNLQEKETKSQCTLCSVQKRGKNTSYKKKEKGMSVLVSFLVPSLLVIKCGLALCVSYFRRSLEIETKCWIIT